MDGQRPDSASDKPCVVVAGATGFVGKALVERLGDRVRMIGLSRSERPATERVSFRRCNLFSLLETERALEGADVVVYLVHSMLPQAGLTQGSFQDLDLLLADNLARAARKAGVKRIVYLGGIVPKGSGLSAHLGSRLEVEQTLASHGVELLALRAGLVVGAGGSSFEMVLRLVQRLPLMVCPRWTTTLGQPVALDDVLFALEHAILDPTLSPGAYDLGGADKLSYVDLMRMTAEALGLRRCFVPLSAFTVGLSLLWLRLITGAPRQLAAPLVESLKHPMLARDHAIFERYRRAPMPMARALDEAVRVSLARSRDHTPSRLHELRHRTGEAHARRVYSVQRMPLPAHERADSVARRYATWVSRTLRPLVDVQVDAQGSMRFFLRLPWRERPPLLLELTHAPQRSDKERELFYITGGLLVDKSAPPGRFEFRETRGERQLITAIHDFTPSLPFYVYRLTQAPVHLWIMRAFARHLSRAATH